jgi:mannonate dehydratase
VTTEQLWQRLGDFLKAVVPVAEEAGVRLAAHPDDPPMPTLRGTARLVYQPHLYQELLDIYPSHYNALEFCQGTIAEMSEGDVYEAIDNTLDVHGKQGGDQIATAGRQVDLPIAPVMRIRMPFD